MPMEDSMTPQQILAEHVELLRRRRRDDATIACSLRAFRALEAVLDGDHLSADVAEGAVYALGERLHPVTVRGYLHRVRAAYAYAHRRGRIPANPWADVELPRQPDKLPDVLTNAQLRSCIGSARNDADMTKLLLLAYAGLRQAELAGLRWADVNLVTAFMEVRGKGAKLRRVPLHPALADALLPHWRYGPGLVVRNVNHHWLGSRAPGIGGFHVFRRTLATSLVRNGVSTDVVDRILGWSPSSVRARYYVGPSDADLHGAVLKAYAEDPL